MRLINAPPAYAELTSLLERSPLPVALNFSRKPSSLPQQRTLNPAASLRLLHSKPRLYRWLQRYRFAQLPLERLRRDSPWPLWSFGSRPRRFAQPEEALQSKATLFLKPIAPSCPQQDGTAWRLLIAGGEIIDSESSADGIRYRQRPLSADARTALQAYGRNLHRLSGLELLQLQVLMGEDGLVHPLDLSLPATLPAPHLEAIAAALLASAEAALAAPGLQPWQIVGLLEPILQNLLPPHQRSWQWRFDEKGFLRLDFDDDMPPEPAFLAELAVRLQEQAPAQRTLFQPGDEPNSSQTPFAHSENWRSTALAHIDMLRDEGCSAYWDEIAQRIARSRPYCCYQAPRFPILGILSKPPRSHGEPFAYDSLHFRQLAQIAEGHGLHLLVFSDDDIDEAHSLCWGYAWTTAGWRRRCYPLPRVIYLRGTGLDKSARSRQERSLCSLQDQGCRFLNHASFNDLLSDKLRFHHVLAEDARLSTHLPETRALQDDESVVQMLQRYDRLYLKPLNGHESRGLVRLRQIEDDRGEPLIEALYNDPTNTLHRWGKLSPMQLRPHLHQLDGKDYLVQQGITAMQWQGSGLELRLNMQKLRRQWFNIGAVMRLSSNDDLGMITARHERWQRPETVLRDCFGMQSEAILGEAKELAFYLSQRFDRAFSEVMEFSLDFLIDTQGKLWILEANAKPSSFFVQLGDDESRRRTLAMKLEHAKWLLEP